LALRLSALLNPILPFDFPESELTRPMDMAKRRRMTQLLLLRLFENEVNGRPSRPNRSDSPHLLIMESGQWLDEYSWELLRMVNQRIPNLVIVVATRPLQEEALAAPLPKACRSLFNSKKAQKVSISLLSPDQIAALLCQKERIASLPEVMTAVLSSRTGGHPLYSEELIAHWQNHRLIAKTRGGFEIVSDPRLLATIPIPERIQKAITGRLDNLPPLELLILKTASAIGVNFTLTELADRYPITAERSQLTEGLAHLEQLQLIRRVNPGDSPAFTFIYGFVQEVANSLLSDSLRGRILRIRDRGMGIGGGG
jgi:predicted ATPase